MQRTLALVGLFSVAIVVTVLYHAQRVHATPSQGHERGCSVASLKGTYAFRRTGVNNVVGGPIAQIGINVLNGEGRAFSFAPRGAATVKSKTGQIFRRPEATRSIRTVPGRSTKRKNEQPRRP